MSDDGRLIAEDEKALARLGYAQELRRGMSAFSNYAISLSMICILAGGITSFQVGFCSVGGAAVGIRLDRAAVQEQRLPQPDGAADRDRE